MEPIDDDLARDVGVLLGRAGTLDVVDAAVVLSAQRRGGVVYTSGPDDLELLASCLGKARFVIARQLNKGENLHALRRSLAYAGEGAVRRRHHEQQTEQMWCLTLATNAIVTWTTEYHGLAVAALRRSAGGSTTKSSPTFGRPTTRTSTSTAPTPSTSTAS